MIDRITEETEMAMKTYAHDVKTENKDVESYI